MSSEHRGNSTVAGGTSVIRHALAALIVLSMLITSLPLLATPGTSDPWYSDDGDMTREVQWNFTNPADYTVVNATVSGDTGRLALLNLSVGENTTADYLHGTMTNVDLQTVPDAMTIDNVSLPVQTLVLQPGEEGKDTYLDEQWITWTPPNGSDLMLNGLYDPSTIFNKRQYVIMEFDLSTVPSGATIVEATLSLYEKPCKALPLRFSIHSVNSSWGPEWYPGVCWMRRDLIHGWTNQGGDFSTESFCTGIIDGTSGWHNFDITRLVDLWTRGKIPNYGFMLIPENSLDDNTKTFADCETNKPATRPMLIINYTTGTTTGSYGSDVLGQGLNSTFTLANWSPQFYSKASDEFSNSSLSTKWSWLNDPRATMGSISFATAGWMNITGSRSNNLSTGLNFLYQDVAGDFSLETSLTEHFAADAMGAGLMIRFDDQKWLALYKTGRQAAGLVIAETRSGTNTSSVSIPWPDANVFLRIQRVGSTYTMQCGPDGATWSTVRTLTQLFDFPSRVPIGLCLYSEDSVLQPVAEFDYARVDPFGQALLLDLSVRTGNSTVLSDPSWTAWSAPLISGTIVCSKAKYIQYSVTMTSSYDWLSPGISGFECHFERYAESGTIVTGEVTPLALASWQILTANQLVPSGQVGYWYSVDHGSNWIGLGSGTTFSIPLAEPSLMVKISLATYDTLSTPCVYDINLQYLVTHVGFYVSAPATVVAGIQFDVTVEAKDDSNATQTWTGPITLNSRDPSGVLNSSAHLYVTNDVVPNGHLVISNERYDVAETIRILVTGGGASGISNPVTVVPAAIDHIHLDPNSTRLPEDNSSEFTAIGHDAFENVISASATWHAETSLGYLNATTGRSVVLTTSMFASGGYLNVTIQSMTLARYIEVAPLVMAPQIDPLPTQTRPEDFGAWTLDISSFVSDREDSDSQLKWYTVNESKVSVSGENRTGNLVMTFTTIQDVFGMNELEVRVVDSSRMMARAILTVNITPVNDPPRIDPIDPLVVRFSDPYQYNLRFYLHDVETSVDNLTISVDAASASYVHVDDLWLTFNYPQFMNGTQQSTLVTVTDEDGAHADTLILVTVTDDYVPETRGSLPDLEMYQGDIVISYFDLDDYFSDPDGDLIIYTYGNTHVTVVIHSNNTVDFYAPASWSGEEYIVFRANDSQGARAESAMVVKVIAVNQPPTIAGIPDILVRYGDEYTLDLSPYVTDLDDEPGHLTVMTNDPHVWAEGLSLTILYPSGMMGMKVPVTITVSDGSLSDSYIMNITVSADHPPVIAISPPDFSFYEDEPRSYPEAGHINDFFADEDGDSLTFFAFLSSPNVTAMTEYLNGNWTIAFNPDENWNGLTRLTIRAVDGSGGLVETTVQLIVIAVPDPPVLTLPDSFSVTEGTRTVLDISKRIVDPDSTMSDFRFVVAPEYAQYVTVYNGMIIFEFPEGYLEHDEESRDLQISITVFDQDNKFSTDSIAVTVNKVSVVTTSNPILWIALLASAAAASIFFIVAVMRRKKPFIVRDMMLIHNDGFLIGRQATPVAGEIDEQILSGMLTAVLNFVEDSMAKHGESLTTFGFREYQVMVKRGEKMFAAVVFQGDQPAGVETQLDDFIDKLERIYRKNLDDWTGDIEKDFAGVDVLIKAWVRDNSKSGKKGVSAPWKTEQTAPPNE